jgi:hypothetical protein
MVRAIGAGIGIKTRPDNIRHLAITEALDSLHGDGLSSGSAGIGAWRRFSSRRCSH